MSPGTLRRYVAMVVAVTSIIVSATTMNAVFVAGGSLGNRPLVIAGVASVGGALVAVGLRALGQKGAAVVFGHALMFTLIFSTALFSAEGPGGALSAVWHGATVGWNDLLRVAAPALAARHLMVPIALLCWAGAAVAAELLFRSSVPATAVGSLIVVFSAFVLLGVGSEQRLLLGVLQSVLLLTFVWLSGGQQIPTKASRPGPAALSAGLGPAVVVAVTGLGLVISMFAVNGDRFDPRDGLTPPVELRSAQSPLSGLKRQITAGFPRSLFSVELLSGTLGSGPIFVRTSALDSYDGVLWRSLDTFPAIGARLDGGVDVVVDAGIFEFRTDPTYRSQYLPTIGDPVRVDVSEAGFSQTTDTLVTPGTANDLTYRLETSLPVPLDQAVQGSVVVATEEDEAFLRPPPQLLMAGIEPLLDQLDGEPGSGARLLELRTLLLDGFSYSTTSPSGHNLSTLQFYSGFSERGDSFPSRVGYSEQAAALFALTARADGYPTRLGVGYRLQPEAFLEGPVEVTEADAWAWVEVRLEPAGWVALDVTPTELTDVPPPPPLSAVQGTRAAGTAPAALPNALEEAVIQKRWWAAVPWRVLVVSLIAGIALAPAVWKHLRRRRRLKGSDAAEVTIGRWLEIRDRMREMKVSVSASFTPAEVVRAAQIAGVLDADSVVQSFVTQTNRALFEPETIDPSDHATQARLEKAFHAELRDHTSRATRFVGRLGPRGLAAPRLTGLHAPAVYIEIDASAVPALTRGSYAPLALMSTPEEAIGEEPLDSWPEPLPIDLRDSQTTLVAEAQKDLV